MSSDEQSRGSERDRESSASERDRSDAGDPPSVPPFADGPKPQTMYGMPAVDVFGDVESLFDVPTLGAKPSSGPKPSSPKSGSPPPLLPELPPLPTRKGPPPPKTGPNPVLPTAAGTPTPTPTPTPKPKPQPAATEPEPGVPSSIVQQQPVATPTRGTPLPSAAGLIAKIRAAKQAPAEPEPEPEPSAPAEPSSAAPAEAEPAPPLASASAAELDQLRDPELEATIAVTSKIGSGAHSTESPDHEVDPSPPSTNTEIVVDGSARTPLAPPPPSTSAAASDPGQPRLGVPYEPPALILRKQGEEAPEAPAESVGAEETPPEAEAGKPERHGELPRPARLPTPGARRPPASPPIATRVAAAAGTQPTQPPLHALGHALDSSARAPNSDPAAPIPVTQQDTGALIDGLANEIIAEAQRETAVTLAAKTPKRAQQDARAHKRRKFALYFLGAAAAISLIVALLPSDEDDAEAEPAARSEPAEQLEPPESEPPEPQLAQAEPEPPEPEPEPELALAETETGDETETSASDETGTETETGADEEAEADQPETRKRTRKRKSSKPKPKPEPKPEPKPVSKPAPGGPGDPRDDKQLYTAAKAAYNSGRAAEAYKLAYASWRKRSRSRTAELMTLAACKMKDKSKASSSLRKVTAIRRNAVKKDCAELGLSL